MSNFDDVLKKIKQQAIRTLQTDGGKEGKKRLTDKTNELLYEAQEPTDYERTYELRDSVDYQACDSDKVRIFFDTNKINPYEKDGWNQHMSSKGEDVSEKIPEYLEMGHGGLYKQKPIKMVEKTKEELEQTKVIHNIVREGLKKKGFKVK